MCVLVIQHDCIHLKEGCVKCVNVTSCYLFVCSLRVVMCVLWLSGVQCCQFSSCDAKFSNFLHPITDVLFLFKQHFGQSGSECSAAVIFLCLLQHWPNTKVCICLSEWCVSDLWVLSAGWPPELSQVVPASFWPAAAPLVPPPSRLLPPGCVLLQTRPRHWHAAHSRLPCGDF